MAWGCWTHTTRRPGVFGPPNDERGERRIVIVTPAHSSSAQNTRALMRRMGTAAGEDVHIEPGEQTALLDASLAQTGVICGGVPGGERSCFCYGS